MNIQNQKILNSLKLAHLMAQFKGLLVVDFHKQEKIEERSKEF